MNLSFLQHPIKHQQKNNELPNLVPVVEPEYNITEGGEFLDDAIRMADLTFTAVQTEERIAPGSAKDLL